MRKWFFIVLPVFLAVTFVAVYYLVSSAENSYLSLSPSDVYKIDEVKTRKKKLFPISSSTQDYQQKASHKTSSQNKQTSLTNKSLPPTNNFSSSKVGEMFSISQESESDIHSISPSGAGVSKLPYVADTTENSSKTLFIAGLSPAISFSLNFVNEQVLPHNFLVKNVPVGGLSALSYDPSQDIFIALSDDKGRKGPPRFYELKLQIREKEGTKYMLQVTKQRPLRNRKGQIISQIDPEGIDFFKPDQIFISTEGAQMSNLLEPPALFMFDVKGWLLSQWDLPPIYWPEKTDRVGEWGVKENKGFEALSISPGKKWLYLATEHSLHQDDQADHSDKQYIRINRFDIGSSKVVDQFLYPMSSDIKIGNFKGTNGLTDFLSLDDDNKQMITVERVYLKDSSVLSARKSDMTLVRLFLTNCSSASNVLKHKELKAARFITCGKSLLADLSSFLGDGVDNIEGITIGPEVSRGSYLLVLVSDNNFSQSQKTQFLFFHYSPEEKSLKHISRM